MNELVKNLGYYYDFMAMAPATIQYYGKRTIWIYRYNEIDGFKYGIFLVEKI